MKVSLRTNAGRGSGAIVTRLGSFDPAGPSGLGRYAKVPGLGALIAEGAGAGAPAARARVYGRLAADFSAKALGPFLYPAALWSIAAKGVEGPGLTTVLPSVGVGPAILWEDVSMVRR